MEHNPIQFPLTPESSFQYYHELQTAVFRDQTSREFRIDTERGNGKYGYYEIGGGVTIYTHETLVSVLNANVGDTINDITLISR